MPIIPLIQNLLNVAAKKSYLGFVPHKKIIRIFIAGSTKELPEVISTLDSSLTEFGKTCEPLNIELRIKHYNKDTKTFVKEGEQNQLDKEIQMADIFIALLYNKVGDATQQEIELAIKEQQKPQSKKELLICFLNDIKSKEHTEDDSLSAFKDKLYKKYKNYYHSYDTIESVASDAKNIIIQLASPSVSVTHSENIKSTKPEAVGSKTVETTSVELNSEDSKTSLPAEEAQKKASNSKTPTTFVLFIFTIVILIFVGFEYINSIWGYGGNTGKCGNAVIWSLEGDTLTLSGTGYTYDWPFKYTPWYFEKENIQHITIDPGIKSIGNNLFRELYNLSDVSIPDSLISIGEKSFAQCESLTSFDVTDAIRSIDKQAFYSCLNLEEFRVSKNNLCYASEEGVLLNYERNQLIQYPAGKPDSSYIIPESVIKISNAAFYNCNYLLQVDMADSVSSIGAHAFENCLGLRSITLSPALTAVEKCTFKGCVNLSEIEIPATVTIIGDATFENCENLSQVTFLSMTPCTFERDGEGLRVFANTHPTIYYPSSWNQFPDVGNASLHLEQLHIKPYYSQRD